MQDNGGERELVLGNKQLLAIFFVAALLCGVFFAVGYVVGGNSAKAGGALVTDGSSATTSEGKHEEPPPTRETASTQVVNQAAPPATTDSGGTLPAAEPMVRDNPTATGAQPPSVQSAPAPVPYTPAPKPAAQVTPAVKPPAPAAKTLATGVFISVPEAGTSYWQVIAIGRPTADELVRTLREGKLPAILAESPKPDLFRVLVGPYRSQFTLSDAKKKLTDLGYNAPVVQKY